MLSTQQIPISVLTGFLGSGKTTALNHLLRQSGMAKAVVIVNEFGEIGIDHELIESTNEDTVLLQSGCLCCTIRNDLIDTLQSLFRRRARGEILEFDRVVIETTGLADPAPILQALMTDPIVTTNFRLDGVIATVDTVAGQATLDRYIEAVKQAAVADRIVLTKMDLAAESEYSAMEGRLRAINPAAPILCASKGAIDPSQVFDIGLYNVATKSMDVQRWLNEEKYARKTDEDRGHHGADPGHRPADDISRHDHRIHAVCLVLDRPISGEALDRWLETLLRLRGPDLLRFKAIINVAELPGPLVAHGVQHVIYPPMTLKKWPSDDRRTRMVFITDGIDEQMLRDSLEKFADEAVSENSDRTMERIG
jgi:G3E family GTPase